MCRDDIWYMLQERPIEKQNVCDVCSGHIVAFLQMLREKLRSRSGEVRSLSPAHWPAWRSPQRQRSGRFIRGRVLIQHLQAERCFFIIFFIIFNYQWKISDFGSSHFSQPTNRMKWNSKADRFKINILWSDSWLLPLLFSVQKEGLGSDQKSIILLNMSKVLLFFFLRLLLFALSTRSLSSRLPFSFPPVAVVVTLSPGRRSIFNDPAVVLWKWASAGEVAAGPKARRCSVIWEDKRLTLATTCPLSGASLHFTVVPFQRRHQKRSNRLTLLPRRKGWCQ